MSKAKFQAIYFRRNTDIDRLIIPASEDPYSHVDRSLITKIEYLSVLTQAEMEPTMSYDDMVKWVFEALLNGLLRGQPLRSTAADIVLGLSNIIADNNRKEKRR